MLEFEYHSEKHVVLNDVVLSKHIFGSSVDLRVTIEDEGTYTIRGDGVVIATPTGSTAYNYSAGGPIMMESCDSIVITPVCAHHGTTRSLVVRGDKALKFSERDNQAMIFADGNEIGFIEGEILIKRSNEVLGLYITDDMMGKIQ